MEELEGLNKSARKIRAVAGEVVNDSDMVDIFYDDSGIEDLVRRYAFETGSRLRIDQEAQVALVDLSLDVAELAYKDGEVDVVLIRQVFDRLYSGMNQAAGSARGLEIHNYIGSKLLARLGLKKPSYRQVVKPLDDKYWNSQFLEQFHEEKLVPRPPDEPENIYLARYTAYCLQHFPWSYYTYSV